MTASNLAGLMSAYQLDQTFDSRGNRAQLKAAVQSKFDLQNDYTYDALSRLTTLTQTKQGTGANYNVVADKRVDFARDTGHWKSINLIRWHELLIGAYDLRCLAPSEITIRLCCESVESPARTGGFESLRAALASCAPIGFAFCGGRDSAKHRWD